MRRGSGLAENLAAHLHEHVTKTSSGCWLWQGSTTRGGYGYIKYWDGKTKRRMVAHRFVYLKLVGPIADDLTLDHLCRRPLCVNPSHVEPVSIKVNLLRGDTFQARNHRVTHCPQGHPYDEANTLHQRGKRLCRECRREAFRRWYASKRAAA